MMISLLIWKRLTCAGVFIKPGIVYVFCLIQLSTMWEVDPPYSSPLKTYLNFRNSLFLLYKNLPDNKLKSVFYPSENHCTSFSNLFSFERQLQSLKAVWKAHMDYYKAIDKLKGKREAVKKIEINAAQETVLNKSIVFEFYIKGNKTYKSLIS